MNFWLRMGVAIGVIWIAAWTGGTLYAETQGWPATKPNIGNGRLVVCGQNAYNYFVYDLTNSRCNYSTVSGLEERTDLMVQSLRYIDADIYAFNELENAGDTVLAYLTHAMNAAAGKVIYAYVSDNCTKGNDSEQIKSGFIYRTDKVQLLGTNHATTSRSYYRNTMRWQAFTELSSDESFVLSMNHFKSKSGSDDGSSQRQTNAQDLIHGIASMTVDPDLLIMGDMNCTISEDPLVYIVNNGFVEQLLQYNASAYSYIYSGSKELIDHVFANSTMATQITGAGVFHVNTSSSWNNGYKYSDHDPYLVGINLGGTTPDPDPDPEPDPKEECTDIDYSIDFKTGLGTFSQITTAGTVDWRSNASYGVCINGYGKSGEMDSWFISPAFDLSDKDGATITFRHNLYKDNSAGQYAQYQTLWVSNGYTEGNTPDETEWTQVTINNYTVGKYVNCTITVPAANLQDGFRYAFRYQAPDGNAANYWEIDNTALTAKCKKTTAIENAEIDMSDKDTHVYSIMGNDMTAQKENLPVGMYILVNGVQTKKIIVR